MQQVWVLEKPDGQTELYIKRREAELDIPARSRNKKVEINPGMWQFGTNKLYKLYVKKIHQEHQSKGILNS